MPEVEIDGASVNYETRGTGPALLMLLPQSSGPVGLEAFVAQLAQHHLVITYHRRGSGSRSTLTEPMSMADEAADVARVLNDAGVDKAHLFCHSTGCGIGLSLATSRPRSITSLCLVNPWTWGDPYLTSMQTLRIAAARALDAKQYSRFNAALLFPPQYRREHHCGFTQMAEDALSKPQDPDEFERRLHAILDFDARTLMARVGVPTVVVGARDDQLMPAWFSEEAGAKIPDAKLHLFDTGGHMLPETQGAALLEIVLAHTLE